MKITPSFSHMLAIILIFTITACSTSVPPATITPMPTTTDTPVPPTATLVPTPTSTPIPMVSIRNSVDCYSGPAAQYDKVASLEVGVNAKIIGISDDNTFWIVMTADGEQCWIAKEYATVIVGETTALPLMIPPATPTLSPPAAPSELSVIILCTIKTYWINNRLWKTLDPSFVISWIDNSENEDGFIIYKDGLENARLPANSTEFIGYPFIKTKTFITNFRGPIMVYSVAAYNMAGVSGLSAIQVQVICPQ